MTLCHRTLAAICLVSVLAILAVAPSVHLQRHLVIVAVTIASGGSAAPRAVLLVRCALHGTTERAVVLGGVTGDGLCAAAGLRLDAEPTGLAPVAAVGDVAVGHRRVIPEGFLVGLFGEEGETFWCDDAFEGVEIFGVLVYGPDEETRQSDIIGEIDFLFERIGVVLRGLAHRMYKDMPTLVLSVSRSKVHIICLKHIVLLMVYMT